MCRVGGHNRHIESEGSMLDTLDGLVGLLRKTPQILQPRDGFTVRAGDLYCPPCGESRKVYVEPVYSPPMTHGGGLNLAGGIAEQLVPSLFVYSCVQCEAKFTAIVYNSPDGPALAVLPSCRGGLTTPHTPEGVGFYLDQAHKAQSIGANSATIAMFRGALEHLLFEQGYKKGMLGEKIKQLTDDISSGTAPKWALGLDVEFLNVLKDLGNGSIHPNDGDVKKQSELDNELLERVKTTFQMLLYLVYEEPFKKDELLSSLRVKANILKKKK